MTERRKVTVTDIDQLRAGLLDHDPQVKAKVESAMEHDQALRAEFKRWDSIGDQLESIKTSTTQLNNQLRLRRRQILSGKTTTNRRRFSLPQMALATASSVALTLGLVMLLYDAPPPSTASSTATYTPTVRLTDASPMVSNVDFDLTNNVDFYVWMEDQNDVVMEVPRKGT